MTFYEKGKTEPHYTARSIVDKIKAVVRLKPNPPQEVLTRAPIFEDAGVGAGPGTGALQITPTTRVSAEHSVTTITVATIYKNAEVVFVRAHYNIVGSTNQVPIGYQAPPQKGGAIIISRVYTDGNDLKVDFMNTTSVDIYVRVIYTAEVTV